MNFIFIKLNTFGLFILNFSLNFLFFFNFSWLLYLLKNFLLFLRLLLDRRLRQILNFFYFLNYLFLNRLILLNLLRLLCLQSSLLLLFLCSMLSELFLHHLWKFRILSWSNNISILVKSLNCSHNWWSFLILTIIYINSSIVKLIT